MEKKEFTSPDNFVWEAPAMEEFKVFSRFHGDDASGEGDSYTNCSGEDEESFD